MISAETVHAAVLPLDASKSEKGVITWMEVKNDEVPLPDEVKDFATGSTSSVPVVYESESTSSKTV